MAHGVASPSDHWGARKPAGSDHGDKGWVELGHGAEHEEGGADPTFVEQCQYQFRVPAHAPLFSRNAWLRTGTKAVIPVLQIYGQCIAQGLGVLILIRAYIHQF